MTLIIITGEIDLSITRVGLPSLAVTIGTLTLYRGLPPSFNENDFEVVSGGLLMLSVLVPNAASFVQRARMLMRRGQIRDRRKLLALADAEVLERE
jgi:hypothetical protein